MTRRSAPRLALRTLTAAGASVAMACMAAASAHADVIATYNLDYVDDTRTAVATTAPNVSASRYFAFGSTQIFSSDNHGKRIDGGRGTTVATIDDSVANHEYGEFTITVAGGMEMDLASLNIGMQITRGADTESFTVHLRSSIDGFANDIDTATLMGNSSVNVVDGPGAFDLSDPTLQGLTGATTFRLYLVTDIGSRTDGSQYVRITPNVVLEGAVSPIPEPATLALTGFSGIAMLRRRAASRG